LETLVKYQYWHKKRILERQDGRCNRGELTIN